MENMKEKEAKIEAFVENELAPALDSKCSATVTFYGFSDEGKAKMGLKTTCGNCPRARATILQSVKVALKTVFPEIPDVEPIYW